MPKRKEVPTPAKRGKPKPPNPASKPELPRPPLSAYMLLLMEQRESDRQRSLSTSFTSSKLAADKRWRAMRESERAKYDSAAADEQRRYEREYCVHEVHIAFPEPTAVKKEGESGKVKTKKRARKADDDDDDDYVDGDAEMADADAKKSDAASDADESDEDEDASDASSSAPEVVRSAALDRKPVGPLSPFMRYFEQERPAMLNKTQDLINMARLLADKWVALTPAQQAAFESDDGSPKKGASERKTRTPSKK